MNPPHANYNPHSGDPAAPINPRLLTAMNGVARNDNPDTRHQLYSAILDSNLIVALPVVPDGQDGGLVRLDEGVPLNVVLVQDLQGRVLLPVFTDTTALFAWQRDCPAYAAMEAPMFLNLAAEEQLEAIVVNAAGPTGGEISLHEISILAQGAIPQPDSSYAFPEDAHLIVRYPEEALPAALAEQLKIHLSQEPEIQAAYEVEVVFPDGRNHLLVGIQFARSPDSDTLSAIMQDLVTSVRDVVPAGLLLDFMVISENDALSGTVMETGLELYRHSTGN